MKVGLGTTLLFGLALFVSGCMVAIGLLGAGEVVLDNRPAIVVPCGTPTRGR